MDLLDRDEIDFLTQPRFLLDTEPRLNPDIMFKAFVKLQRKIPKRFEKYFVALSFDHFISFINKLKSKSY